MACSEQVHLSAHVLQNRMDPVDIYIVSSSTSYWDLAEDETLQRAHPEHSENLT